MLVFFLLTQEKRVHAHKQHAHTCARAEYVRSTRLEWRRPMINPHKVPIETYLCVRVSVTVCVERGNVVRFCTDQVVYKL